MNGIHEDVAEKYKICGTHGAVNGSKRDLNSPTSINTCISTEECFVDPQRPLATTTASSSFYMFWIQSSGRRRCGELGRGRGRGEAQLIGNIWVIVGSTTTSRRRWLRFDGALWSDSFDLGVRACVHCSCQRALWLEKRTEPGAPGAGWCRRFWRGSLLTANVSFAAKTQPACWCVCQKKPRGVEEEEDDDEGGEVAAPALHNIWGTRPRRMP